MLLGICAFGFIDAKTSLDEYNNRPPESSSGNGFEGLGVGLGYGIVMVIMIIGMIAFGAISFFKLLGFIIAKNGLTGFNLILDILSFGFFAVWLVSDFTSITSNGIIGIVPYAALMLVTLAAAICDIASFSKY